MMKATGLELLPQSGLAAAKDAAAEGFRRRGAEAFARTGLPTRRDEDWKYTSLKPLTETRFRPSFEVAALSREALHALAGSLSGAFVNLVFVNGELDRTLSNLDRLPAGVELAPPRPSEGDFTGPLDALSAAYFGQGATLRIAAGVVLQAPLCLRFHVAAEDGPALTVQPRLRMELAEGSSATVLEWYTSQPGSRSFTNASLEISVAARARLELIRFQDEDARAVHVGRTSLRLGEGSEAFSLAAFQGAAICRHELDVVLEGSAARLTTFGLGSLAGDQQLDQFARIDHRVGACSTQQISKTLLAGRSRSAFTGQIKIRPHAQKADSQQLSKSLLLSDQAESNSRPQLMIEADDVKASHGATVGHVSDEEIFYLRSRGLSRAQAMRLLSFAFLSELLEPVSRDDVRSWLRGSLEAGFARMEGDTP